MAEKLTQEKLIELGKLPTSKIQDLGKSSIVYDTFESDVLCCKALGAGAATGTEDDVNKIFTGKQILNYSPIGTQTIVAPVMSATGLNISQDLTENDGVQYYPSEGAIARGKQVFTIGTDAAFYARCRLLVTDVSGTDDLLFGFRKVEAIQAANDDYADLAALNLISGDIYIETIKGGAATVATDTTDDVADLAVIDLYVEVSAAGVVTYKHGLNGGLAAPTTTASFTFDDAEVVVPFLFALNSSDVMSGLYISKWEVGYVSEKS